MPVAHKGRRKNRQVYYPELQRLADPLICNLANMILYVPDERIVYAAEVLQLKHIIVCRYYCCGSVTTAMINKDHEFVYN